MKLIGDESAWIFDQLERLKDGPYRESTTSAKRTKRIDTNSYVATTTRMTTTETSSDDDENEFKSAQDRLKWHELKQPMPINDYVEQAYASSSPRFYNQSTYSGKYRPQHVNQSLGTYYPANTQISSWPQQLYYHSNYYYSQPNYNSFNYST